jgi:putative ABC transport system substrate-binding protein
MNNRRKLIIALGAGALAAPFSSLAQPAKIYRIGILSVLSAADAPNVRAFKQAMEGMDWIDGKNISIEHRYANGDVERLPALALDLVRSKVDIILSLGGTATGAANRAAGTIPIVFVTVIDPVGMGFVTNRAQPGGNITGITGIGSELIAKRLQVMKEAIPKFSRVAVITTGEPTDVLQFAEVQSAARASGIEVLSIKVRSHSDLAQALALIRRWHADAMYVFDASLNFYNRRLLAEFAAENRIPMIAGAIPYAEAGGLIGYGPNYEELSRRAATLVDKILKGAKPADIPVERSSTVELTINMRTAKILSLKIAQSLLQRADKVID